MTGKKIINCDLAVIGTGMAGMAAAVFAGNRNINTVQVGDTGGLSFASGLIDLMGSHPVKEMKARRNPWTAIDCLKADIPRHPYCHMEKDEILAALEELLNALDTGGLPYTFKNERNTRVITPAGTTKTTWAIPRSMAAGADALEKKRPGIIIDIQNLKGFSARQIVSTLGNGWPDLNAGTVRFPGYENRTEIYPEQLARSLDMPDAQETFAGILKPLVKNAEIVGIPAVLGLYTAEAARKTIEERLGVPLFEIPVMSPSVPGIRLMEAFDRVLQQKGVTRFLQKRVTHVQVLHDETFLLTVNDTMAEKQIHAEGIVLASGRFIGKGLCSDRNRICEPLLGLRVVQPESRSQWFRYDFFDPEGHPVNRAGIETDSDFRPTDASGEPAYRNLFASGSILAHQDWKRMKCGSGLSIATSWKAVESFRRLSGLNI